MIAIKADFTKMANEQRNIEETLCDVTFTQKADLQQNFTTIHEDKKSFYC